MECPSCQAGPLEEFYQVRDVPVNSCLLLTTPETARGCPRGQISLGFCGVCGFVSNMAHDERMTEYSGRYEETQGFSATFGTFHEQLATRLIDRYDLRDKEIVEIGCGKGEFLALLCRLGHNRGVGFDPGFVEGRLDSREVGEICVVRDFYSEKYADRKGDFVCCKMTLEHIHAAGQFVGTVRRGIGERPGTIVFFQVPESTRILREGAFEDIYYEHCSYFSPGSLERLFRRSGFEILEVGTEYGGQYLTIEAKVTAEDRPDVNLRWNDLAELRGYVGTFGERCRQKLAGWRKRLDEFTTEGRRVALWGSGSKGVSFLTTLGLNEEVTCVVDINPHRRGHYMAGTGHPIVGPDDLPSIRPEIIIAMNGIYREEIERDLVARGLAPEVMCL
jgi:SAM-dependent methyltransferase